MILTQCRLAIAMWTILIKHHALIGHTSGQQSLVDKTVIIILLIELKSSIDLITFLKVYEDEIL